MVFTPDQAEKIKQQLLAQVENLPNENKEQIKAYISQLNETQLEDFIRKNNIQIQGTGENSENPAENNNSQEQAPQQSECIFCSIIKDKIPHYKLAENKKSIAILEINPLSKGHAIVLPKAHLSADKLPKSALSLAQTLSKKIRSKLKPDDIKIETSNFMGHALINIIPSYKSNPLQKRKADESELKEMQEILQTKKRAKKEKIEKPSSNLPKISFRIP